MALETLLLDDGTILIDILLVVSLRSQVNFLVSVDEFARVSFVSRSTIWIETFPMVSSVHSITTELSTKYVFNPTISFPTVILFESTTSVSLTFRWLMLTVAFGIASWYSSDMFSDQSPATTFSILHVKVVASTTEQS